MLRLIILGFVIAVSFDGAAYADDFYSQKTCGYACPNPCTSNGLKCCFCDDSKNLKTSTCACCKEDEDCCSGNYYTRYKGGVCCPKGSTCQSDGTCRYKKDPVASPAINLFSPRCKEDTRLMITADDRLTCVYLNGKRQTFPSGANWTEVKYINLPSTINLIAVCAWNNDRAAGIMCQAEDKSFRCDGFWKCSSSIRPEDEYTWYTPEYDDSTWDYCYEGQKNDKSLSRLQKVNALDSEDKWIWVDKGLETFPYTGWKTYCYARYTPPFYPATK